jgi:4-amino-4-deoxychorismate lyase
MNRKESKYALSKFEEVANLSKVGNPICFETIKIQNRHLHNIAWHNQRFNQTRLKLHGIIEPLMLENFIQIPSDLDYGTYKCRIIYAADIEKIEFENYSAGKIQSLKVVECNSIDYSSKYYDRTKLNELLQQKGNCDDILIVKNGLITDTSYANIVFWDGVNWVTPSRPLLAGTARARHLDLQMIFKKEIRIEDLEYFKKARIVNAMVDLNESNDILDFGK